MERAPDLGELQSLLVLVASLSHGLEQILGRGAAPITFRAGRWLGLQAEIALHRVPIMRGDLSLALLDRVGRRTATDVSLAD